MSIAVNVVLLTLIKSISYSQQKNDCPDSNKHFIGKNLEIYLGSKKYVIYEAISKAEDTRSLVLTYGGSCLVNSKSLLSTDLVSGYATNYIKNLFNGFMYSFEYGNRYHYEYKVYFKNRNDKFFLYKIIKILSDLKISNNKNITKTTYINDVPFEKFNINNYAN